MAAIRSDQQRFDEEVARKGKTILQALAGLGIFAALVLSVIAIARSGESTGVQISAATANQTGSSGGGPAAGGSSSGSSSSPAGKGAGAAVGAGAAGAAAPASAAAANVPSEVSLNVSPEIKKGPEGTLHDAFTVTEYHVIVGKAVTLKIDNTDSVPHSITSPEAGVNIVAEPGTHEYKLLVSKAGKFEWHCIFPCDPWSMEHVGYMRGYITATQS